MIDKNVLWVEKYRPTSVDGYLFTTNALKNFVGKLIVKKELPNILFYGPPGTGKTTIAKIILSELDIPEEDILILNASDKNSVDDVREDITNFVSTMANGYVRVVVLEEFGYFSQNAQGALRCLIEQYSDNARFILTTNEFHKVIMPIRSRCQVHEIKKHSNKEIFRLMEDILKNEKVKYDKSELEKYVAVAYPDIRKIIQLLQQNTSANKKLLSLSDADGTNEVNEVILKYLSTGEFLGLRQALCPIVDPNGWENVYRFLYENADKCKKCNELSENWKNYMLIIAEHLYKNGLVCDQEINFTACCIKLSQAIS